MSVQALKPGVVKELFVADGQHVIAGQQLASVRLEDEQGDLRSSPEETLLRLIKGQSFWIQEQIKLAKEQAEANQRRERQTISMLNLQIAAIDAQLMQQNVVLGNGKKEIAAEERLTRLGAASERDLRNAESSYASSYRDLSSLQERRANLRQQLSSATADLELEKPKLDDRLADLENSKLQTDEHTAQTQGQREYTITAPIAGTVTSLTAQIGYPADSKSPLMAIVPDHAKLQADLFVPSSSIAFIKKGERVRLLYDAFPFEKFGSQGAGITHVSTSVRLPTEIAAPVELKEPVYLVSAHLDQESVGAFGVATKLQPGMKLKANIILEKRSVFEWIFDPIFAVRGRV